MLGNMFAQYSLISDDANLCAHRPSVQNGRVSLGWSDAPADDLHASENCIENYRNGCKVRLLLSWCAAKWAAGRVSDVSARARGPRASEAAGLSVVSHRERGDT